MAFKRFDPEDIVVSAEAVTVPTWSDGVYNLASKFFSNVQASGSGEYYLDVFKEGSTGLGTGSVQYSIAYCDKDGRGEVRLDPEVGGITPTSILYRSYKNLIYGNQETFPIGGVNSDFFYVININRARYKEKLKPGSLNIQFKRTIGRNNLELLLSEITSSVAQTTKAGRCYDLKGVLSGANTGNGTYSTGTALFQASGSYGMFLPDVGLIVLNGQTLNASTGSGGLTGNPSDPIIVRTAYTTETEPYNIAHNKVRLHYMMEDNCTFTLSSEETISSNYIFARIRNSEFNHTTNPTILNSSGDIISDELINDPKTFVTGIGLHNDNNDLLAVAKLSRPLQKDFRKEALFRIKLDF